MRTKIQIVFVLLCFGGLWGPLHAGGENTKPVNGYVAGFGGYSFPQTTDVESGGITGMDAELDRSPSYGGKVGIWLTGTRKALGIDLGFEGDVTSFHPDLPGGQVLSSNVGLVTPIGLDLHAIYFGLNVLARLPMGVTSQFPNGRWFPYIGVGGGAQRVSFEATGTTEGRDTAPAFQGLGGVTVFLTKHIAVFGEGKFTRASHTLEFMGSGGGFSADLTVQAVHGVGGVAIHF